MIGELYTMNGVRIKLVQEEVSSSCTGCYFLEVDEDNGHDECLFKSDDNVSLECGEVYGIYKKIDLEKGVKKKLTLN